MARPGPGYTLGMEAPAQTLENALVRDLQDFAGRFGDDQLCVELYRALTNRALSKDPPAGGHLVLSWTRAAAFVNELRDGEDQDPLPLSQSGGEGVMSERVSDALEQHGWRTRPLSTARPGGRESPPPER